jgi:hypothetical protein
MKSESDILSALMQRREKGLLRPDTEEHSFGGLQPPISINEIQAAERLFGASIPPFLAKIYGTIANGGFGPDYGLLPLLRPDHYDVVHTSLSVRSAYGDDWPKDFLIVGDQGCELYHCVDCSKPEGPVYLFTRDTAPEDLPSEWFLLITGTIREYFSTWLDGTLPYPCRPE